MVRTSGRLMGVTFGAILEEIQALYQEHHQPCFLYLSSEVINIFGSDPSCSGPSYGGFHDEVEAEDGLLRRIKKIGNFGILNLKISISAMGKGERRRLLPKKGAITK